MKKSIISIVSASIISMSLVGCQSTQETNLDEYLANNVDETIWILNTVYDNGQQIFNDPNEPIYYEGTIEDALNNEKDYTYVSQKLDNLYNKDISAYNRLYSYISTNDLNGLKRMYNQYEEDIKTNKTDSSYHILKTIKYATSNFTTTYYIGLNRDYFEAMESTTSDADWVELLSEEDHSEYSDFRNNLESFEASYANDYVRYATICDIVNGTLEGVKMNQTTEQEALITEGTCGDCGTSNIDIMDNAGGYICNECGHIGTVNID